MAVVPRALQGQKTTVLINAFENQTGDGSLDWIGEGLASAISERLAARPELYVFGLDERFAEYERLGIPETTSVSRATAIRIAWDMGADILVTGRILGNPGSFQIDARILNLADALPGTDIRVSGKLDEVIPMAALTASQLAKQLVPGSTMPESDYAARPPVPRSAFEAFIRGIVAPDSQRRMELIESAIRLHPQYNAAIYQLGKVHYLDSDYKASNALLERIPANASEYPQARFMVAMNAYHLGEHAKAAEIYAALPAGYDVLVNLGAALAGSGDGVAAAAAWRHASERDQSGSEAAFNLGYLAFSRQEWEVAASRLARFLELHAGDSEALFLLGQTYDRLGRAEEAKRLTAQAIRLSPRLGRWNSQGVPNLARVRTQFNATELRLPPGPGIWNDARRLRKAGPAVLR